LYSLVPKLGIQRTPPTTAISGGSQRQGIRTWHFLRRFECGASWTAVALYLSPKAEFCFWASWAGRSPARAPRSGAGGGAGGERPRPSGFCAVAGRERASGPTRRAKWAKNWFALGHSVRATRSRQDESKEVHEAGRIRPPLGCNGVHVLSLYPLIWRSLPTTPTCTLAHPRTHPRAHTRTAGRHVLL
jgi:hypothetical protein